MTARLTTVAPDLVELLERQTDDRRREVAAVISEWIVSRVGLADGRLDGAMALLRDRRPGSPSERAVVRALADELDEVAWDIQDRAQDDAVPPDRYDEAFARARAATAVWSALDDDASNGVLEAVYEAQAATGEVDEARQVVRSVLS